MPSTFNIAGQNLSIKIPDEGEVFRYGDQVLKRQGGEVVQLGSQFENPQIRELYNKAPFYPEANVLWEKGGIRLNPQPLGIGAIGQFQLGGAVAPETLTQTVDPTNVQRGMVTSDVRGAITPEAGKGVIPPVAPTTPATPSPQLTAQTSQIQQIQQKIAEVQKLLGVGQQQKASDIAAGKAQTFQPGTATPTGQIAPSLVVPTTPTAPTEIPSTSSLLSTFTSDKDAFANILAQIKQSFGFDESTKEIEKLDDKKLEELAAVSDNPWLSETLRSKQQKSIEAKYEGKRDALVNRLRLGQDMVGKALDVFYKEREFQKDLLFKNLDLKDKELDRKREDEIQRLKQSMMKM